MSVLKNPRHERFAQEIAKGTPAAQAYASVGFRPNSGNAATLKASQGIVKRVAEILKHEQRVENKATEKAIEALAIDKAWVMGAMVENALISLGRKRVKVTKIDKKTGEAREVEVVMRDAGAANRSLELLGREFRMWIERAEVGGPGEFARMNDVELEKFIAEKQNELGAFLGEPLTGAIN